MSCGRSIAFDANVCPFCGHDYRPQAMAPVMQKKDSALPVVGGIFLIIISLIYLGLGGIIAAGSTVAMGVTLGGSGWGIACGALILVLGVLVLLGGIFAIQKKHWAIALIACIFTLPSVLGIVAIVLIAISRDSFES